VAERAAAVLAPPYDVVDVDRARQIAGPEPDSFLHVTRPEIDLPDGACADDVHRRGRRALRDLTDRGVLVADDRPTMTVYRQRGDGAYQTGVVGLASVADYRAGILAVHEHTRPDKGDDRTEHMRALDAHDEPVLVTYPGRPDVDALVDQVVRCPPSLRVTDPDGVEHTLWTMTDDEAVDALQKAFAEVSRLYIADGHHRSAAAARLHESGADAGETDAFPVVAFPAEQLTVLPYQRVVADLHGLDLAGLPAALEPCFAVDAEPTGGYPADLLRHQIALYAGGGRWHRLTARPGVVDERDPIGRLDVSLLQDRVLAPLLGVADPRTDARISFVGGTRSGSELERLVDSGRFAVAFGLHPTSTAEVMAVADRGLVMPPKSTWFHPKLGSGLFVHAMR
jgi:uncharacterized protein (DUF1015 family)